MWRLRLLPGLVASCLVASAPAQYEPNWASLDARPLPGWYDDAKLGIFIHWGVYSVPAYNSEWIWHQWKVEQLPDVVNYIQHNYPPTWTYQSWGPLFTASLFDPAHWAELFAASGARYVVITAKHHDGFALYPSKYSANWNSDVGPGRDLLGELRAAILAVNSNSSGVGGERPPMRFGLYHSMYEWFHPLYVQDKAANFSTNDFVTQKVLPELHELVERFQPDVVWSDGDGEATSDYWKSEQFLAWLYNESPVRDTVVTNDRWGAGCPCAHGGFFSCDDRYVPGALQPHKYESCQTIDRHSWGYRREARLEDFLSIQEVLNLLVTVVATNGNVLLNVGPDHHGVIHPVFEERLRQLGAWLDVNGDAIYGTRPWDRAQNDPAAPHVWYTASKDGALTFAVLLEWPEPQEDDDEDEAPLLLHLASPKAPGTAPQADDGVAWAWRGLRRSERGGNRGGGGEGGPTVTLLGFGDPLVPWREAEDGEGIVLDLSKLARNTRVPKRDWAWAFVLEGFE